MDSIIGRTILGYKVIERIGAGGFGDVYKVERNNIIGNVTRALKVITLPREKPLSITMPWAQQPLLLRM